MQRNFRTALVLVLLAGLCSIPAHAGRIALLLEQPYGRLGAMDPLGHVSIYLSDVCAATPVRLRRCDPGERGVVISRYHHIDGYDWIAMPLLAYLYAVNEPSAIPDEATHGMVVRMRDKYRRAHLLKLVPDDPDHEIPQGDWTQLLGESYLRKIYGFSLETTPEQDDALIAKLNSGKNHKRYNLLLRNCANFAENILNFYYPHSIHRNFIVDLGAMTPKQAAHSLEKYAKRHPGLNFTTFVIPQVPGKIERSSSVHGILDAVLETKKYVVPLAVLNPEVVGGLVVVYLSGGRYHPGADIEAVFNPRREYEPGMMEAANAPMSQQYESEQMDAQSRSNTATSVSFHQNAGRPSE